MVLVYYDKIERKSWETMSATLFPGWTVEKAVLDLNLESLEIAKKLACPKGGNQQATFDTCGPLVTLLLAHSTQDGTAKQVPRLCLLLCVRDAPPCASCS